MREFSDPVQASVDALRQYVDPFGIASNLWRAQKSWLQHPQELTVELNKLGTELWQMQLYSWQRLSGFDTSEAFPSASRDERFLAPIWHENPYLDVIKEYYLLYTHWLEDALFATPELDEKTRRRAAFWVRQGLNAMAPTNFFWTNPYAVQRFLQTGGASVLDGFKNGLKDGFAGDIRMVDETAFEVGQNLATTPGQVVFRNELLELIQYHPTTDQVRTIPILVVAPWINKYYILDLNQKKSLLRYLVSQGFTVFVTSWKNPTPQMHNTTFDDYLINGLLPAIHAVRSICEVPQIHATGYCIGGTLLAILMAWLTREQRAPEEASAIAHWTLLTTLVDFSAPGDIDIFIDEQSVAYLEDQMAARGYIKGDELAWSFRMLRSNSLIWNYYVHNYLYGEEPPQFDVLYWNTDSTRLPAAMHSYYLREFYLANKLVQPDAVTMGGHPINLRRIEAPLYAVGTEQDHIAPWKETFKTCSQVQSGCRYVLATSGHIMGIISPPVDPPKRRFWVGEANGASDPEAWRNSMPKKPGSWWEDWTGWLAQQCGPWREPPPAGNKSFPALGPAPGTYVLER